MSSEDDDTLAASAELKAIPISAATSVGSPVLEVQQGSADRATNEANALEAGKSSRQLEREAKAAEHHRAERFRNHFERLALWGLYAAAVAFTVMTLVWLLHLIAPSGVRWLSPDDLSTLQNFVTGGIIASIAAGHLKKRLGG